MIVPVGSWHWPTPPPAIPELGLISVKWQRMKPPGPCRLASTWPLYCVMVSSYGPHGPQPPQP